MAKKSKTQRAKASAARAAKKVEGQESVDTEAASKELAETTEADKRKFFKKDDSKEAVVHKQDKKEEKPAEKKAVAKTKPKKKRFQFLYDVRSELRRVTWPTKQDVLRWSGVVVAALLFFGLYTFALDSLFTQVLLAISNLGVIVSG